MITWQKISDTEISLNGVLSQSSVSSLMPIAPHLSSMSQPIKVELSGLSHVDSAGLAFLVELKEQANKKQLTITFTGSTTALEKLISLYNAQILLD